MLYDVYLLSGVSCRASGGSSRQYVGESPADSLILYIFDRGSKITHGGEAQSIDETCESIFFVTRSESSHVVDDGQPSYIVPYDASDKTTPPEKSHKVASVKRLYAGSPRMWHWKVTAK